MPSSVSAGGTNSARPEGERRRQFDHAPVTRERWADGWRNQRRAQTFSLDSTRGEPSEADMLLMCLPFVIYSASMQMFLDSLSPAPSREYDRHADRDR